ncbi:metallopeptidase family protein [uncultured Williamsia sp.]|uniref:metallopeptidase family protein n=1 Tax=uncultured Williamsia sp. TaxID=259311 RepID=UPI002603ABE6|nr:metallopeptidase family protein [uncultured Williamsia sp.]
MRPGAGSSSRSGRRRRSRDRRGRGLRSRLLPPDLPAANTRSESFDLIVLEAFAEIDARWHDQLGDLDLAVDEIPRMLPRDPETVQWPDEVTADGAIPLARLLPAGIDAQGRPSKARIVVFRKPLESRADSGDDLVDLVHEVLVHQVATHLGVDEDTIDPDPR